MRPHTSGPPANLSEVLAQLFTARGWGRKSERVAIEAAWATAVGPAVDAQTRVNALRRGVLEVEVRSGVLMQELAQFRKRELLGAVRKALPASAVTDIKFRTGVW